MEDMNNTDIKFENTMLWREIEDLKKRLAKMQANLKEYHELVKDLRKKNRSLENENKKLLKKNILLVN